ncbi:MAG TPA: OmpA family protein [Chitinophagaceae bacterium]
MKKAISIGTIAFMACVLTSCVSAKKMREANAKNYDLFTANTKLNEKVRSCEDDKRELSRRATLLENENENLNKQVAFLKENNNQALKQLEDLSVISSSQAESIKKSLENMGSKDAYIQDLQASIARKDSLNMVLVMNLKGAVADVDDKDINIKVDKGVVYIDISDKLLFKSGSYDINSKAKSVLAKVAAVLRNQPQMEFMVEGHTDNVPFKKGILQDNWDLSVKRATSVVRALQNQYGIPPSRIVAAGRSEYLPVTANISGDGRAANRRTRIIILPKLDEFFKLLAP